MILGQSIWMFHRPFHFVREDAALPSRLFSLKQQRCLRCGQVETLNLLRGHDPVQASGQVVRGQRVCCSNRGQRGGCGKTFSLVLADFLPRCALTASLVWRWLVELLAGLLIKAPNRPNDGLQKKFRKNLGLAWTQDVQRRSFGTCYYNLTHDPNQDAHDMGNSVAVCKRHYVREVEKAWTNAIWGLRPQIR